MTARLGAVRLGCHLTDLSTRRYDHDYFRATLTPGQGVAIRPGDEVAFDAQVPCPPPGSYELAFDLVSEEVVWFELNRSKTCSFRIEVRP